MLVVVLVVVCVCVLCCDAGLRSSAVEQFASRTEQQLTGTMDSSRRRTARMSIGATTAGATAVDGHSARRDFLSYALSLMRSHNDEHADNLPTLDITSLKHVAYVLSPVVQYNVNSGCICVHLELPIGHTEPHTHV